MTGSGPASGDGVFITLEGPEGAGKSTQARRLADHLRAIGREVVLTREPGGTRLGERIRAILLDAESDAVTQGADAETAEPAARARVDALLFNAARVQLLAEVVEPALERGAVIVCDRFADSTLAYQGFGSGVPLDALRSLQAFATGGRRPDLTLLLDVPARRGLARKAGAETRFERDFDLAFHERVRDGFLALAHAEPDRFVRIDASRDPDAVFADVVRAVSRHPAVNRSPVRRA